MHRSLLWRVVKTNDNGTTKVVIGEGEGRSAYVQKDLKSVTQSQHKNRLAKALRCKVPRGIYNDLKERAAQWDRLTPTEKGFVHCEAYGVDGVSSCVDEVQEAFLDEWARH